MTHPDMLVSLGFVIWCHWSTSLPGLQGQRDGPAHLLPSAIMGALPPIVHVQGRKGEAVFRNTHLFPRCMKNIL